MNLRGWGNMLEIEKGHDAPQEVRAQHNEEES